MLSTNHLIGLFIVIAAIISKPQSSFSQINFRKLEELFYPLIHTIMWKLTSLNRRNFIKASTLGTGGLVLGFYLPLAGKTNNVLKSSTTVSYHAPNAFIKIGTDESINIIVNHAEMGQGIYTSLCQIIADELDVDWKNVKAVHAPFSPDYNHTVFPMQLTGGSTSVNTEWQRLRNVAATSLAYEIWRSPIGKILTCTGASQNGNAPA